MRNKSIIRKSSELAKDLLKPSFETYNEIKKGEIDATSLINLYMSVRLCNITVSKKWLKVDTKAVTKDMMEMASILGMDCEVATITETQLNNIYVWLTDFQKKLGKLSRNKIVALIHELATQHKDQYGEVTMAQPFTLDNVEPSTEDLIKKLEALCA